MLVKPKLFILAGGSGVGKTTIAAEILKKHPKLVSLVHTDDYFRPKSEVPVLIGMENWDHPDALDWERFTDDINSLLAGKLIRVRTKHGHGTDQLPARIWTSINPIGRISWSLVANNSPAINLLDIPRSTNQATTRS